MNDLRELKAYLRTAERLSLFLDYDGTLADFTNHPDRVIPDAALIEMLRKLAARPGVWLSVISGRRLAHIEKLVPLENLALAGTYGIEMRLPGGEYLQQLPLEEVRPLLLKVKSGWLKFIEGKEGFILEDKNWSLALHGLHANAADADLVMRRARLLCEDLLDKRYRLLGGERFFEAAPRQASKAETVRYFVQKYALEGSAMLYIGDDDKDEEAFPIVQQYGGRALAVLHRPRPTEANDSVSTVKQARDLLREISTHD